MGSLCSNYVYRLVNLLENRRKMVETALEKWNKAGMNDLAGRLKFIKRHARTPEFRWSFLIYRPDHPDQTRPHILKHRPTRPDHVTFACAD